MVSLDHQTPFEKPVAFVMLQVFQVVQSSVIVVSMTCVNSALVKTLTRRGVLRSRKISSKEPWLQEQERMVNGESEPSKPSVFRDRLFRLTILSFFGQAPHFVSWL